MSITSKLPESIFLARPIVCTDVCRCGANTVGVDPARIRVVVRKRRVFVVRCPHCPR